MCSSLFCDHAWGIGIIGLLIIHSSSPMHAVNIESRLCMISVLISSHT